MSMVTGEETLNYYRDKDGFNQVWLEEVNFNSGLCVGLNDKSLTRTYTHISIHTRLFKGVHPRTN